MVAQILADIEPLADSRRVTEHDPQLVALKRRTERRLTLSIKRLMRDLKPDSGMSQGEAQSAFIHRHVGILRNAYLEAHRLGQRQYFDAVSREPGRWARMEPDSVRMARTLAFYAPSVSKMAHEAAIYTAAVRVQRSIPEATHVAALSDLAFSEAQGHSARGVTLADAADPTDAYAEWEQGLGARIMLQADLTWSGMQDGYTAAGWGDSANPFQALYWNLEPVAQHCSDCPAFAAGSPYDPPWTQGPDANILNATPGDGNTECGAACRCDLSYGPPDTARAMLDMKQWAPEDAPGLPDGPMQPAPVPPRPTKPTEPEQPEQPEEPGSGQGNRPFVRETPYGPMIPGGEFNEGQKRALDLYRLAELEWNDVRGALPELPNFFTLANPNFSWPRLQWEELTKRQQKALSLALEAWAVWNANVPQSWRDLYDDEYDFRDVDGAGSYKLFNPNHDARGRFAVGSGGGLHVSGGGSHGAGQHAGMGHIGAHVGAGFAAGGGGGGGGAGRGQRHGEEQYATRIARAEARHQRATEAHELARTAHEHATQKAEHAQAKMRAEEAKLRATQERVIAKAKGDVLAEQAVKAPKTFARYEAAKMEHEAVSAAIKSHEREVQHAYNTMGRIQRATSEAHPEGFTSYRAYRAALRQHADFAQYRAAEKTVKEQNARHLRQLQLERTIRSSEKQLIGKRLDPAGKRIQEHPDMVTQRGRLEKASAIYNKAAARARETNETYTRAENELHYSRIGLEAAHSPSGVSIHYGDMGQHGTQAELARVFGRTLSDHEVAQLAGAKEGDIVRVQGDLLKAESGRFISVVKLSMVSGADGSTNSLLVERTAKGDIVIHHEMVENAGAKSASSGKDVIEGLRNWQRLGVTRLEATAARSDATHGGMRTRMNGYDTWAKLGFTGKIPRESNEIGYHNRDLLAEAQAKFGKHVTRVEQLMRIGADARRWWKENGSDWHATFSFRPNSYSMRTLAKYEAILNRHGR